MSGRVPSSAVAGSSAAGMQGPDAHFAPGAGRDRRARSLGQRGRRPREDEGQNNDGQTHQRDAHQSSYTWNLGHRPAVARGKGGGRAVRNLLPKPANGGGNARNGRGTASEGGKCSEFKDSTGGKYAANLDFLFSSRLYFEHEASLVHKGRTRGNVRRDGL